MPLPVTIHNHTFSLPDRFSEGHVCTADEAMVLNAFLAGKAQLFVQREAKKAGVSELTPSGSDRYDDLEARTVGYFQSLTVVFTPPRAFMTPAAREAEKMARNLVVTKLNASGVDPKTVSEAQLSEYISNLLTRRPEIFAEAEKRVKASQHLALSALMPEMTSEA